MPPGAVVASFGGGVGSGCAGVGVGVGDEVGGVVWVDGGGAQAVTPTPAIASVRAKNRSRSIRMRQGVPRILVHGVRPPPRDDRSRAVRLLR